MWKELCVVLSLNFFLENITMSQKSRVSWSENLNTDSKRFLCIIKLELIRVKTTHSYISFFGWSKKFSLAPFLGMIFLVIATACTLKNVSVSLQACVK